VVKAVKRVLPAVVSISMTKYLHIFESSLNLPASHLALPPKKRRVKLGGGSGFVVLSSGIILTNRHVIEEPGAEYTVILQSGEKVKPRILAVDPIHDIAILEIKKHNLPTVELGNSSKIKLGQTVIAIGNALGLFQNTVSTGVVSGLSREIRAQHAVGLEAERTKLRGLIQTDAAINPGNSGGPLIDLRGRAVGINAAMVFGAENIGFALPINNGKKALQELEKYGRIRQPFLGLRYLPITKDVQKDFSLSTARGALVVSELDMLNGVTQAIIPGSPADRAGIKEGDIILEVDKKKITPEQSINDVLMDCQVGEAIPIKIMRQNRQKTLRLILGEKKVK